MSNINTDMAWPKWPILGYGRASLIGIILRLYPWLAGKIFDFQITERILEYPFCHEEVKEGTGNLLDVGSGSSLLPFELTSKGYNVWSLDLHNGYCSFINDSNLTIVQQDIRNTNFPDNFFDIVTAISTIEHVGLGNKNSELQGDRDAVREIKRILKTSGKFLITMPFGKPGLWLQNNVPQFRVYNFDLLEKLLDGFIIEKEKYGVCVNGNWRISTRVEAENIDSLDQRIWHSSKAVAMVLARRL